jgi:hypothetical protein
LWEDVSEIKYIGSYLKAALNREYIFTCKDLVDALEDFGEPWENETRVRWRVRDWLRKVLTNARANERCYPKSRVIDGDECAYLSRETNQKGYNAILNLWRYYTINPYKKWIPRPYTGLMERNKYPRRCNMNDIYR